MYELRDTWQYGEQGEYIRREWDQKLDGVLNAVQLETFDEYGRPLRFEDDRAVDGIFEELVSYVDAQSAAC
jgi:hypothetical protein